MSLSDALQQVNLEVGQIYHCQLGRLRIEVRVEEISPVGLPAPLQDSDIMLDPWIDLPSPRATAFVQASAAPPVLPDVRDITFNERYK